MTQLSTVINSTGTPSASRLAQPRQPPEPGDVMIMSDFAKSGVICYEARKGWNNTQALPAVGPWPDSFSPFAH